MVQDAIFCRDRLTYDLCIFSALGCFTFPWSLKKPVCLQYSLIIPQYLLQRFIDIRHVAIAVLKDDYLIDTSLTWNNRLCHDDITSSCLLAYKTALKVGIWNHSCQLKESNTLHLYFFPVSFFKTDFRWFTRLTAVGKLLQVCTYES